MNTPLSRPILHPSSEKMRLIERDFLHEWRSDIEIRKYMPPNFLAILPPAIELHSHRERAQETKTNLSAGLYARSFCSLPCRTVKIPRNTRKARFSKGTEHDGNKTGYI
jgi:hypothetical protein